MSFLKPKVGADPVQAVAALPTPASTPTKADASVLDSGNRAATGFSSLVSTGSLAGLSRKASTKKSSLIGGA